MSIQQLRAVIPVTVMLGALAVLPAAGGLPAGPGSHHGGLAGSAVAISAAATAQTSPGDTPWG